MVFVPAPNVSFLGVIWSLAGQQCESTFHYRTPAPATAADLGTLVSGFFAWFSTHEAGFSNECVVLKAYGRALDSAGAPSVEFNPGTPLAGSQTDALLPNNVTFALTRFSNFAGRANRGRIYHPGIVTHWAADVNEITAGAAVVLRDTWESWLNAAALLTPVFTEVILHRALGTHTDVQGYRWADFFLDSQRRRLPGHNIHH